MAHHSCAPAREECNKYDLTAAPCFLIGLNIMIGPGGLLFPSSTPTYLQSRFQFYGRGCKA